MKEDDISTANLLLAPITIMIVFTIILLMALTIGDMNLIVLSYILFACGDIVAMVHLKRGLDLYDKNKMS